MNDRDELDFRVARWVADLPSRAPDETLDRVLAELPTLPQHGRLRAVFRRTIMQTSARGARASFAVPLAAAAAIVAVAVGAGVLLNRGPSNGGIGGPGVTSSPSAPALSASATSAAIAGVEATEIETPPRPFAVTAGAGAVWASAGEGVVRIDPATNETTVITLDTLGTNGIAATDEAVWVSGYPSNKVFRIDAATNEVTATFELDTAPYAIEVVGNDLFVSYQNETQLLDATSGDVRWTYPRPAAFPIPAAFGSVWTVSASTVQRLDPASGEVVATIEVPPPADLCTLSPLSGVTGIGDSVILGCFEGTRLTRIDVATNTVAGTYEIGQNGGTAIAVDGAWWSPVGPSTQGGFARIDPATGRIVQQVDLGEGNNPSGMATTAADLWLAVEAEDRVLRVPFTSLQQP